VTWYPHWSVANVRTHLVIPLALGFAAPQLGCRDSAPEAATASPHLEATAVVDTPQVPPKSAVPQRAAITVEDAQALLARWVAAQNAGDFATYSALYAQRFEGVKRIGALSRRFERVGWMQDRQRMFGKPMHVEVVDVHVSTLGGTAIVRFEQRWSSGKFADVGAKDVDLVREGGELRIAAERMRTSTVASTAGKVELQPSEFMQIVRTKRTYVVLSERADEAWAYGAAGVDSNKEWRNVYAARKLARVEALPEEIVADLPSEIVLFGRKGEVCRALVGKLFLLRRFVQPEMMDEYIAENSDRDAATLIWQGDDRTLLVAEVDAPTADCSQAFWARSASRTAPTIMISGTATPDLAARVKSRVHGLPDYKKAQAEYVAVLEAERAHGDAEPRPPQWEDAEGTEPQVVTWQNGSRTLVSYSIATGGCGNFGGVVWALFEARGSTLEIVAESGKSPQTGEFNFEAVFDLDGDGRVEAFGSRSEIYDSGEDSLSRTGRNGLVFITEIGTAFHGCGC